MEFARRRFLQIAAAAVTLPAAARSAQAQAYPSRPITMNVPFPAGGPGDAVGRIMADALRAALGQPVIVENVPGANGSIGLGRAARATPDGYTLSLGFFNTHVVNGAVYTLPYDVLNDFEPIALLATYPLVIAGKKALPANDLQALIAWLKANPDKASQGTPGVGSLGHLGGILFQTMTGTHFQHVPYRGNTFAMQDLVSGQIDLMFADTTVLLPQVRASTVKAYAVAGRDRLPTASEIPTVDEAGVPGLHLTNWSGFWVPKATPQDIVDRLNDAVVTALADPGVVQRLADLGNQVPPREEQTPEALRAY